ncbi:hypothetical protein NDA16_001906 [Ustilago loliicola]|nr:hypothetical protein NDA16_001906 [Ustilago loliicola]
MADALVLVVLLVLTVVTVYLRLRYRLAPGVVVHVLSIQCCLAFHFAWRCVRDWAALEVYLNGEWDRSSDHFSLEGNLESLAKRIRREAEDPTLFYVLGLVPLVLAMILIYTLNLVVYTNPPPASIYLQDHVTTRFHLFLDPSAPHIELLPTSKAQAANAGKGGNDSKKHGGEGKGKEADAGKTKGEMLVVKRGWLGGWSVQPAQTGAGWATKAKGKIKQSLLRWALGWSSEQKAPVTAA